MALGPLRFPRPRLLDPSPVLATPGMIGGRHVTPGNGRWRCGPRAPGRRGAEVAPRPGDQRRLRRPRHGLPPRHHPLAPIARHVHQANRAVLGLSHQHPTLRGDPASDPAIELEAASLVLHHVIIPYHARGLEAKDVGIRFAAGRPRTMVIDGARRLDGKPCGELGGSAYRHRHSPPPRR